MCLIICVASKDKDLRSFNESLKQELKLLKQEVDLLPKEVRKDTFQQRKREKEIEHAEKVFMRTVIK